MDRNTKAGVWIVIVAAFLFGAFFEGCGQHQDEPRTAGEYWESGK